MSDEAEQVTQWTHFVSHQLERLAGAGDFLVAAETVGADATHSGRILRYTVAPHGADGRSIIVPTSCGLLALSKLPERATRDLLAPYTLQTRQSAQPLNVPWSRILRDYKQTERRPAGMCTGCDTGCQCPHGWKVPSPRSIVVLSVHDPVTKRQRMEWFVRFADDNKRLVQVPRLVAKKLSKHMERDMRMCVSSLCSTYAPDPESDDETEFVDLAVRSYSRIYSNIRGALKRKLDDERYCHNKHHKQQQQADDDANTKTCIVCLTDDKTAIGRCSRQNCTAATCAKCHDKTRGLCPICDRTAINGDYPCAGCGQLARLQFYGLPCVTCNSGILCKECYMSYEECRHCEGPCLM